MTTQESGGVKLCSCGLPLVHGKGIRYDDHSWSDLKRHFAIQDQEAAGRRKQRKRAAKEQERLGQIEFFTDLLEVLEAGNTKAAKESIRGAIKMLEANK